MQLTGDYVFNADPQTVWTLLMDPKIIADSIPGVKELIPLDGEPDAWRAEIKVSIATISGSFGGTIRMGEIDAPRQYRLTVKGEGQQSIINGSALISLTPISAGKQTRVTWDATADINGKLASIGQRLIESTAKMMAGNFFGGVARHAPAQDIDEAYIETVIGPEYMPNTQTVEVAAAKPQPDGIIQKLMARLRRLFGGK